MGILNNLKFAFSEDYAELRQMVMEGYSSKDIQDLLSIRQLLLKLEGIPDASGRTEGELQKLYALIAALSNETRGLHEDARYCRTALESAGQRERRILEHFDQAFQAAAPRQSAPPAAVGITEDDIQRIAAAVWAGGRLQSEMAQLLQPVYGELRRIQGTGGRSGELEEKLRQAQAESVHSRQETSRYAAENTRLTQELRAAQEELEKLRKLQRNEQPQKPPQRPPQNPFVLTKNRESVLFHAEDKEFAVQRFCDTAVLDRFFGDLPENNAYQKLYQRYRKKLDKIQADPDDELEDILGKLLKMVHAELLKKMVVAVYRAKKNGQSDFEDRLLPVLNQYLTEVGFYTREDLCVGGKISDVDYEDMEFLQDSRASGLEKGVITEIELYPYYINFSDEDQQSRKMHTQGIMIIVG